MRKATEDEVNAYISVTGQMHRSIAMGVFIIIMGVVTMVLTSYIFSDILFIPAMPGIHKIVPTVILLLCAAVAAALFITAGIRHERYEYMEEGVTLEPDVHERLVKELEACALSNTMTVTVGILLCILGPTIFLILQTVLPESAGANAAGLAVMLSLTAIAAVLLIAGSGRKEMYRKLLGIKEYAPEYTKENKVIGVTASIVWPLAAAVFLVWGICFQAFQISWIVFPIVGVLYGSFAAICGAVLQK